MQRALLFALFSTLTSTAFAQGGVTHFCSSGLNGSQISATGSSLLDVNGGSGDLVLHASNVPGGSPGMFVMSQAVTQGFPFGQGSLCLGSPLVRMPVVTNATFALDYTAPAVIGMFTPSSIWNIQFWFRSGPGTFDLSDGLEVTFHTRELITDVVTIDHSGYSGHPLGWTGGTMMIEDQATWDSFWAQHAANQIPAPPAPVVDFSQRAVVAVFLGTVNHGGVTVTVRSGGLSVTTLDVRTVTEAPGIHCPVLWVITQPNHIVSMPRVPNMTLGNLDGTALIHDCP